MKLCGDGWNISVFNKVPFAPFLSFASTITSSRPCDYIFLHLIIISLAVPTMTKILFNILIFLSLHLPGRPSDPGLSGSWYCITKGMSVLHKILFNAPDISISCLLHSYYGLSLNQLKIVDAHYHIELIAALIFLQ